MHYYQHHMGDFSLGTKHFSQVERWLYRDMLEVYYDTESPLPADVATVCDLVGARGAEQVEAVGKILRLKFNLTGTGWVNERCADELARYHSNAEKARNNGKKGGRPRQNNPSGSQPVPIGLQPGSQPEPDCNRIATGLKANQEPLTNNQEPDKDNTTAPAVADAVVAEPKSSMTGAEPWFNDIDPQVVKDFRALRKAKKAPINHSSMSMLIREAGKAGLSLSEAMQLCCARGWTTIKADWINERRSAPTGRPQMHSGFSKKDYTEGVAPDGTF